jgi:hypothetical protein
VPAALLVVTMAAILAGCAGTARMPTWVEHVFPMRGTPPDSPEQREVATHNEATSYLAYQAERHRVLNGQDPRPNAKLVSIADTNAMQQTIRSLVPLGSDIQAAKIALELNGFDCAWEGWRKQRLHCDVATAATPPTLPRWDIKIACQRASVSDISVSPLPSTYKATQVR